MQQNNKYSYIINKTLVIGSRQETEIKERNVNAQQLSYYFTNQLKLSVETRVQRKKLK